MSQTKRKRKHKHRGTQAGTVEARGRTGRRPQTQVEARKVSRERRANRFDRPPSWRSALNRAAVSAAIFAVAVVVIFGRPIAAALVLGVVMVVLYLPMSYYTDRFLYNRRQRQKQARR
jgi:Flp pilus assembly protein TadB